jgi:hypothetical protein
MENRPLTGDRYDPYDPRHPMWSDPFWGAYAVRPAAPPPAARTPESAAEKWPGVGLTDTA